MLVCGLSLYIIYVDASVFYSIYGVMLPNFLLQYVGRMFSDILGFCGVWGVTPVFGLSRWLVKRRLGWRSSTVRWAVAGKW